MNVTINDDKVFEVLETAISDGVIDYWGYTIVGYEEAIRLIKEGKSFDVFDVEEDDKKLATITIEMINKGLEVLINEYPEIFANIMIENADFFDMDVFFQLCCFGEIVFG